MSEEAWLNAALLHKDPLITFSSFCPEAPVGIAMLAPERFQGCKVLHLIRPTWSLESGGTEKLAADIAAAREPLKDNHFIVLANTNLETLLLARLGVPVIQVSALMFIDEQVFRPQQPENTAGVEYDAVYLARLDPYKRHELSRNIESLLLIYDFTLDKTLNTFTRLKGLLPRARFLNHELGNGSYARLPPKIVSRYMNTCRVGLCLSAVEGMTKASMEYLLCGLPIVSVPNEGGRDRFLMSPYSIEAEDSPEAIANAVQELISRSLDKKILRGHILHLLRFERHNFLLELNKIVKRLMGVDPRFNSCAAFIDAQKCFLPASHLLKHLFSVSPT